MCSQCLLLFQRLKASGHFKPSTICRGSAVLCAIAGRGALTWAGVVTCLQLGALCSMAISGRTPGTHPHNLSPHQPGSLWHRHCSRAGPSCTASGVLSTDSSTGQPGTAALRLKQPVPHIWGSSAGPGFCRKGVWARFCKDSACSTYLEFHVCLHVWLFTLLLS